MITDIAILKGYIPTITGGNITKYKQPISDSTEWLQGVLGGEIMSLATSSAEPQLTLLAERVVAYRAYMLSIPLMDVVENNNGFAVVNDDKLAPASKDRVDKLREAITKQLSFALAQLYEYLEDGHAEKWAQRPRTTIIKGLCFKSLRDFFIVSGQMPDYDRLTEVIQTIKEAVTTVITPVISAEVYEAIAAEIDASRLGVYADFHSAVRDIIAFLYTKNDRAAMLRLYDIRRQLETNIERYPEFASSDIHKAFLDRENKNLNSHILPFV